MWYKDHNTYNYPLSITKRQDHKTTLTLIPVGIFSHGEAYTGIVVWDVWHDLLGIMLDHKISAAKFKLAAHACRGIESPESQGGRETIDLMIDDAVILTMCNNNNSYLVTDTQITG